MPEVVHVDNVQVSWDAAKGKWLVRIQAGEEVIRRRSDLPKTADDETLRSAALQFVREEGYEADSNRIAIQH